jgi:hypothetical protein
MNNSDPIKNLKKKNKYTNTDPTKFQTLLGQTNNSDIQTIYKRFYNVNKNLEQAQLESIKNPRGVRTEKIRRERAGTFWKYLLHRIRLTVGYQENVNNTNSNNKSNRVTRSKTEDYLPWVLTKVDRVPPENIRNIEIVKDTVVPSLLGNYTLKYIEGRQFPTVLLEPLGNSKLKSSRVGLFCKGLNTENKKVSGFCSRKELYKAVGNQSSANIYKKGMQGLSIAHIEKLIKKGTPGPRIFGDRQYMAQMLELKRLGDASQVYYAQQINKDNNYCVQPFDTEFINNVMKVSRGEAPSPRDLVSYIMRRFQPQNKYYYSKALFWSNDRPACLLAYILGVPFVYRPTGNTMYMWLPEKTNTQVRVNKGRNYGEKNGGILKEIFKGSDSLKKLAILDTFHDFAKSFPSSSFGAYKGVYKAFSLGDILSSVVPETDPETKKELKEFIEKFDSKTKVKDFENEIGKFLVDIKTLQNTNANDLWESFSEKVKKVNSKEYCVIHDAGKITGTEFTSRRAMSPAIIYDPATSKLNTFSTGINTNDPKIVRNKNIERNNYARLLEFTTQTVQKQNNNENAMNMVINTPAVTARTGTAIPPPSKRARF